VAQFFILLRYTRTCLTSVQEIIYDIDIDECNEETDDCSTAADCTNTVESYTCTCRDGYTGDGYSCEGKL